MILTPMKHTITKSLISACTALIVGTATCAAQGITASVVDAPDGTQSNNYVSFRAPLAPAHLLKLPVGKVQPKGWLRNYLELQRDGLNGQLGTVSAWLDKNNNQWLSDSGDHGWEEVPYWLRGYCSLAYILDDEAMKKEAQTWFEAVLKNQKADGFLGPRNYEGDKPEIWAQMIMLWALQTYYEYSGDQRVLDAMTKYFKWEMTVDDAQFLKGVWQEKRGGDNMWSVIWLYNRTGDESILPLIDKLHRNTSNWAMKGGLPNLHGVNVAQGFREPATYAVYTKDDDMRQATYNAFNNMRERFGQVPGGMYGADENARVGYDDPRQGAETCAIVEQMASDEILMGITSDPFWADHCENVALNTFTASMTSDMKALRYITSPNMAISDEKLHGPSIDNNLRGMLSMSPFSSRCCQHNHGMGWPYYAEHLVMATSDNGLATMLYAASETTADVADKHSVKLTETTDYPFDGNVTLTLSTEGTVTFPLYMRIPSWAKGATVSVNGEAVAVSKAEGRYVRIEREWADGDKVELNLPMDFSEQIWQRNKASMSINYGPLTLSLKIGENFEKHDSRDKNFVQDDSHWQEGVDASLWPCYVLKPTTPWNYALKVDGNLKPEGLSVSKGKWSGEGNPFTQENVPLSFTAVGYQIPSWGYDSTGMTDMLPTKYVKHSDTETQLTLIPMGAARLRISAFPKIVVK